jgi:hypothetical protein
MIGLPAPDPNTYAPERWAFIPYTHELYEISTHGAMYSAQSGHVLKMSRTVSGIYVVLHLPSGRLHMAVYKLMLITFAGMPIGYRGRTGHLNGDGHDNHIENLWWAGMDR